MSQNSPGSQIASARDFLSWKLVHLSQRSGISLARLCAIESDRRPPSEQEWAVLRPLLNLPPYSCKRIVLPAAPKLWLAPEPSLARDPAHPASQRLAAARRSFGWRAEQALHEIGLRDDRLLCEEFLEQARMDSGHEALFWTLMLAAGAMPHRASPSKVGFRAWSVVDPASKECLSDCRQACLILERQARSYLFFPQLTLDTRRAYFRLDALACVRSRGHRWWVNLEVDGQAHDPRYDAERQALLGLPTVRLQSAELTAPDFVELVESKIALTLGLREAS